MVYYIVRSNFKNIVNFLYLKYLYLINALQIRAYKLYNDFKEFV